MLIVIIDTIASGLIIGLFLYVYMDAYGELTATNFENDAPTSFTVSMKVFGLLGSLAGERAAPRDNRCSLLTLYERRSVKP